MASAMDSAVGIAGYLALFAAVGLTFIFVNLLVGRFLRPHNPSPEKLEIYECGEPAIGSSFVQFDLRFYVVALVFIIFDVEVAFLFPWATVFGKVANLSRDAQAIVQVEQGEARLTPVAAGVYRELGDQGQVPAAAGSGDEIERAIRRGRVADDGQLEFAGLAQLVQFTAVAAGVFFVVLLVGFAYEWRTGALDWVRAVVKPSSSMVVRPTERAPGSQESVLSA